MAAASSPSSSPRAEAEAKWLVLVRLPIKPTVKDFPNSVNSISITLRLGIHETVMKWTKERLPSRHPKLCLPLDASNARQVLEISVRTVKKKLFGGTKEVTHGPWGFDLGRYKPYEVISLRGDLSDGMGSIKFDLMVQQEGSRQGPTSHLPHSPSTDSFSGSSGVSSIDQFSEMSGGH